MTECNHIKEFENFLMYSNPPKIPWSCKKCGAKGYDIYAEMKFRNFENLPSHE